jgi:hypothetical protein
MTDRAAITADAEPVSGPRLLSLPTEKMRRFVEALYSDEAPAKGDGLLIFAAREAGYGNTAGTSTNKALSVIANRLIHDSRVQAAIIEYSHAAVRAISPEAVRAVRDLIRDGEPRVLRLKAAVAVLDRVVPIETRHTVTVEDNRPPSPAAIEKVLARIEELARRAGIPVAPPTIDGECVVVEAGGS